MQELKTEQLKDINGGFLISLGGIAIISLGVPFISGILDENRLEKLAEIYQSNEDKSESVPINDNDDSSSEDEPIDINDIMKKIKTIEQVFGQFGQYY